MYKRQLNDDTIQGGMGFGTHPHDNMEIITIPLRGDLEHKDSLGNTEVIREGEIQVMSAGTGVHHSEYNKNADNAISVLAYYSPIFIVGSLTAYLVSQRFDVWFFHYLKKLTNGKKLWLRNNLSTMASQLIDTLIYQFTWVLATDLTFTQAFAISIAKYVIKVFIALIDTIFIYWVRNWEIKS